MSYSLIVVIFILIVIFGLLFHPSGISLPSVTSQGNQEVQILYLLSALAQSLATVFALVFTISIIMAQIVSGYSQRFLSDFFDIYNLSYVSLFIISIIFPLFILAEPNVNLAKVSILLGTASLLFLIPFIFHLINQINPEIRIKKDYQLATKMITDKQNVEPREVIRIYDVSIVAFKRSDYDIFEFGLDALSKLALKASQSNSPVVQVSILDRIEHIFEITIVDPKAPFIVLKTLRDAGLISVPAGFGYGNNSGYSYLRKLGVKALESNKMDLAIRSSLYIYDIAITAIDDEGEIPNKEFIINTMISHLSALVNFAIYKNHFDIFKIISAPIVELGERAQFKKYNKIVQHVITQLKDLERFLKEKKAINDGDILNLIPPPSIIIYGSEEHRRAYDEFKDLYRSN